MLYHSLFPSPKSRVLYLKDLGKKVHCDVKSLSSTTSSLHHWPEKSARHVLIRSLYPRFAVCVCATGGGLMRKRAGAHDAERQTSLCLPASCMSRPKVTGWWASCQRQGDASRWAQSELPMSCRSQRKEDQMCRRGTCLLPGEEREREREGLLSSIAPADNLARYPTSLCTCQSILDGVAVETRGCGGWQQDHDMCFERVCVCVCVWCVPVRQKQRAGHMGQGDDGTEEGLLSTMLTLRRQECRE